MAYAIFFQSFRISEGRERDVAIMYLLLTACSVPYSHNKRHIVHLHSLRCKHSTYCLRHNFNCINWYVTPALPFRRFSVQNLIMLLYNFLSTMSRTKRNKMYHVSAHKLTKSLLFSCASFTKYLLAIFFLYSFFTLYHDCIDIGKKYRNKL